MSANSKFNRREFLKLSSIAALSSLPLLTQKPDRISQNPKAKNVLILVFDAWSAQNTSLFGYPRETTPNLSRIAKRATVYHNFYAGGHWTYPGTATLLTGAYPWRHRGFAKFIPIAPPYDQMNFFGLFDDYHRIAYTHNVFADDVLRLLHEFIDAYQARQSLFLNKDFWVDTLFSNDYDTAALAWTRSSKIKDFLAPYSLLLSQLLKERSFKLKEKYLELFPNEPPYSEEDNYYVLEESIDWIMDQTPQSPNPYFAYYHLFPPHDPYNTRREFFGAFQNDGFSPIAKPTHYLVKEEAEDINLLRTQYDEFILYVDAEFGRLFDYLESNGYLDNTWLVLTSDHGEMFERGIWSHGLPVFHQSVIQVPLLIFEPGQTERRDIFEPAAAVDLLPTMLHVTGHDVPAELEGIVLPPFRDGKSVPNRNIYALDSVNNRGDEPLSRFTAMMVKDGYKLTYYEGYEENPNREPVYEVYDLENDPDELDNLYAPQSSLSREMIEELKNKIIEEDRPFN